MTESGKTTLATNLSHEYQGRGIKTIILDPLLDQRWGADFVTMDKHQFLAIVKHPETRSCAIFVDESGEMVGQYQDEMFWLATRGRHYGHACHFITQRANQISPTVRDQCSYLFVFNCSLKDSKELSDGWNRDEIKNAYQLEKGEYLSVPRWGQIERKRVF